MIIDIGAGDCELSDSLRKEEREETSSLLLRSDLIVSEFSWLWVLYFQTLYYFVWEAFEGLQIERKNAMHKDRILIEERIHEECGDDGSDDEVESGEVLEVDKHVVDADHKNLRRHCDLRHLLAARPHRDNLVGDHRKVLADFEDVGELVRFGWHEEKTTEYETAAFGSPHQILVDLMRDCSSQWRCGNDFRMDHYQFLEEGSVRL